MKLGSLAILVVVTLLTSAFVWVRLQMVTLGYEIDDFEKKERMLREECNILSLQINETKSPRRLESLAKSKFKMRAAKTGEVIVLR